MGAFNDYVDTILTTTYLYVNIFNLQSGQKYAFFLTTDHPVLVHVVIEHPPVSLFVNVNEVNEKVEELFNSFTTLTQKN